MHVRAQFEQPFGFDESSAFSMEAFHRQYLERVQADLEKSATSFREVIDRRGLAAEWLVVDYAYDAVVEHARYADLAIFRTRCCRRRASAHQDGNVGPQARLIA